MVTHHLLNLIFLLLSLVLQSHTILSSMKIYILVYLSNTIFFFIKTKKDILVYTKHIVYKNFMYGRERGYFYFLLFVLLENVMGIVFSYGCGCVDSNRSDHN